MTDKLFLEDTDEFLISSLSPKKQFSIFIDSWKKAGINLDHNIEENAKFYRTVNKLNLLQIDIKGLTPRGKIGHFMNASPIANMNIKLEQPNDVLTFIKTNRKLRLLNLLKLNFILGMQLKQGEGYGAYSRGLFDFMNEGSIKSYCIENNYDGVINMDYVDSLRITHEAGRKLNSEVREISNNLVDISGGKFTLTEEFKKIVSHVAQNERDNNSFIGSENGTKNACFPEFYIINNKDDTGNYTLDYINMKDELPIQELDKSNILHINSPTYKNNIVSDDMGTDDIRDNKRKKISRYYPNLLVLPINKISYNTIKWASRGTKLNFDFSLEFKEDAIKNIDEFKERNASNFPSDFLSNNIKLIVGPELLTGDEYNKFLEHLSNSFNENCDFMALKSKATKIAYKIPYHDPKVYYSNNGSKKEIRTESFLFKVVLKYSSMLYNDLNYSHINKDILSLILSKYTRDFSTFKPNIYIFREFIKTIIGKTNKYDDYEDIEKEHINSVTKKYIEYCKYCIGKIQEYYGSNIKPSKIINVLDDKDYDLITLHIEGFKIKGLSNDNFYKFYLKGGGTLLLLSNIYATYIPEEVRIANFGDVSDFDYNISINAYLEENDYNYLYKSILNTLKTIGEKFSILLNDFFNSNNKTYIDEVIKLLGEEGININKKFPMTDIFSSINLLGKKVDTARDATNNGYVFYQFKDSYNFKLTGTEFALLRLMLSFNTESINEPSGIIACSTNTAVELIDISVIKYNAKEKLDSWKKIRTKGIELLQYDLSFNDASYNETLLLPIYGMDYAISDLETVIRDNKETGKTAKLAKREKRLKVLNDFRYLYIDSSNQDCTNFITSLKYWNHNDIITIPNKIIAQYMDLYSKKNVDFIYGEGGKILSLLYELLSYILHTNTIYNYDETTGIFLLDFVPDPTYWHSVSQDDIELVAEEKENTLALIQHTYSLFYTPFKEYPESSTQYEEALLFLTNFFKILLDIYKTNKYDDYMMLLVRQLLLTIMDSGHTDNFFKLQEIIYPLYKEANDTKTKFIRDKYKELVEKLSEETEIITNNKYIYDDVCNKERIPIINVSNDYNINFFMSNKMGENFIYNDVENDVYFRENISTLIRDYKGKEITLLLRICKLLNINEEHYETIKGAIVKYEDIYNIHPGTEYKSNYNNIRIFSDQMYIDKTHDVSTTTGGGNKRKQKSKKIKNKRVKTRKYNKRDKNKHTRRK